MFVVVSPTRMFVLDKPRLVFVVSESCSRGSCRCKERKRKEKVRGINSLLEETRAGLSTEIWRNSGSGQLKQLEVNAAGLSEATNCIPRLRLFFPGQTKQTNIVESYITRNAIFLLSITNASMKYH